MLSDELEALLTPSLSGDDKAGKEAPTQANPNNAKADPDEERFLLFAALGVWVALMIGVFWIGAHQLGIKP